MIEAYTANLNALDNLINRRHNLPADVREAAKAVFRPAPNFLPTHSTRAIHEAVQLRQQRGQ